MTKPQARREGRRPPSAFARAAGPRCLEAEPSGALPQEIDPSCHWLLGCRCVLMLHPVATTGSRTFGHAPGHGFASKGPGRDTDWRAIASDGRQYRDDPLLRENQDATRPAPHGGWSSGLWGKRDAHTRLHPTWERARFRP